MLEDLLPDGCAGGEVVLADVGHAVVGEAGADIRVVGDDRNAVISAVSTGVSNAVLSISATPMPLAFAAIAESIAETICE